MRCIRTTTSWAAWAAICGLALAAGAAHHESAETAAKAWDAERMTQLTGDLAKAMGEVRTSFRQQSGAMEPRSPKSRSGKNMDDILKDLARSSRQLHAQVKGGAGAEETQGIARKIGTLLNDADVVGRQIMTTAWTAEKIRPAMALINEIAPYYGAGPLYDPASLQRLDRPPNFETPPPPTGE